MGHRGTLRLQLNVVPLSVVALLVLFVYCDGLKPADVGTCNIELPVQKWKVYIFKSRCPKGYRECSKKEKDSHPFNQKTQRCCAKKVSIREKKTVCCEGWEYLKAKDICIPQCHPVCENGNCIAPNTCQCEQPLVLNGNKCVTPTCDPACVNAECIENNTCACLKEFVAFNSSHCARSCEAGFKNDPSTLECVPDCDTPCLNGRCTGKNFCSCFDGFVHKDDNLTCIPECNSCNDGDCVAPNVCQCHNGFENKDGLCKPVCDTECSNGTCVANVCKCDNGYESDPLNTFNCFPKCVPDCVNSFCISPNKCQCLPGYEEDNRWSCKPVCDSCEHGQCIAPNTCKCDAGYSIKDGKCIPQCDKIKCDRGTCTSPNVCTCESGYTFDKATQSCEPKCDPVCVNASCSYPNFCFCFLGYEPIENSSICRPSCHSCDNGTCVAPDVCICEEGYELIDGKCLPICTTNCTNAYCSSPQECSCNHGFIKHDTLDGVCFKFCNGPCNHGKCNFEGECFCDAGYKIDESGDCKQLDAVDCELCRTNCTEDENCWCTDGRPCYFTPPSPDMATSNGLSMLAGLQLTWTVAGAVALLLVTLLIIVMTRLYRRPAREEKVPDQGNPYGSVIYTVPDTLINPAARDRIDEGDETIEMDSCKKETSERLLTPEVVVSDDIFQDAKYSSS